MEEAGSDKFGKRQYKCECKCGNVKVINGASLTRRLTTSCGCYKGEVLHKGCGDISIQYWRRIKRSAYERGLEFTLTPEEIWDLYIKQNRKCAFTGILIYFYKDGNRSDKITASIDRIDSKKGYTIDNVQIVYKLVNLMKRSMSDEEFIGLCKMIYENRILKK